MLRKNLVRTLYNKDNSPESPEDALPSQAPSPAKVLDEIESTSEDDFEDMNVSLVSPPVSNQLEVRHSPRKKKRAGMAMFRKANHPTAASSGSSPYEFPPSDPKGSPKTLSLTEKVKLSRERLRENAQKRQRLQTLSLEESVSTSTVSPSTVAYIEKSRSDLSKTSHAEPSAQVGKSSRGRASANGLVEVEKESVSPEQKQLQANSFASAVEERKRTAEEKKRAVRSRLSLPRISTSRNPTRSYAPSKDNKIDCPDDVGTEKQPSPTKSGAGKTEGTGIRRLLQRFLPSRGKRRAEESASEDQAVVISDDDEEVEETSPEVVEETGTSSVCADQPNSVSESGGSDQPVAKLKQRGKSAVLDEVIGGDDDHDASEEEKDNCPICHDYHSLRHFITIDNLRDEGDASMVGYDVTLTVLYVTQEMSFRCGMVRPPVSKLLFKTINKLTVSDLECKDGSPVQVKMETDHHNISFEVKDVLWNRVIRNILKHSSHLQTRFICQSNKIVDDTPASVRRSRRNSRAETQQSQLDRALALSLVDAPEEEDTDAVVDVSKGDPFQDLPMSTLLCTYDGVRVLHSDAVLCLEGQLLNDVIIDFYLRFFQSRLPDVSRNDTYIYSTFFLTKLMRPQQYNFDAQQKWTRDVDLFKKKLLIIPYHNERAEHWSLFLIWRPDRMRLHMQSCSHAPRSLEGTNCMVIYLDSLRSHRSIPRTVRYRLCLYFLDEYRRKVAPDIVCDCIRKQEQGTFAGTTLPFRSGPGPIQDNASDCGVFVLKNAEWAINMLANDVDPPYSVPFYLDKCSSKDASLQEFHNWGDGSTARDMRRHLLRLIRDIRNKVIVAPDRPSRSATPNPQRSQQTPSEPDDTEETESQDANVDVIAAVVAPEQNAPEVSEHGGSDSSDSAGANVNSTVLVQSIRELAIEATATVPTPPKGLTVNASFDTEASSVINSQTIPTGSQSLEICEEASLSQAADRDLKTATADSTTDSEVDIQVGTQEIPDECTEEDADAGASISTSTSTGLANDTVGDGSKTEMIVKTRVQPKRNCLSKSTNVDVDCEGDEAYVSSDAESVGESNGQLGPVPPPDTDELSANEDEPRTRRCPSTASSNADEIAMTLVGSGTAGHNLRKQKKSGAETALRSAVEMDADTERQSGVSPVSSSPDLRTSGENVHVVDDSDESDAQSDVVFSQENCVASPPKGKQQRKRPIERRSPERANRRKAKAPRKVDTAASTDVSEVLSDSDGSVVIEMPGDPSGNRSSSDEMDIMGILHPGSRSK